MEMAGLLGHSPREVAKRLRIRQIVEYVKKFMTPSLIIGGFKNNNNNIQCILKLTIGNYFLFHSTQPLVGLSQIFFEAIETVTLKFKK